MRTVLKLLTALVFGTASSMILGGLMFRFRAQGELFALQPSEPFDAYFLFCGLPGALTGLCVYQLAGRLLARASDEALNH